MHAHILNCHVNATGATEIRKEDEKIKPHNQGKNYLYLVDIDGSRRPANDITPIILKFIQQIIAQVNRILPHPNSEEFYI